MLYSHHGLWPNIHETAFIAPSADVIGEVAVGEGSSVWFRTVVRGDVHWIRIGKRSNIQDLCLLHVTRGVSPLTIGDDVTVGHHVTLHGCTLGDRILVGMGAIVMDDAVVGSDCMIGAGSIVTRGTQIPDGHLAMGTPAKVIRPLTDEEKSFLLKSSDNYVKNGKEYMSQIQGPKRYGQQDTDLENASHLPGFQVEELDRYGNTEGDDT